MKKFFQQLTMWMALFCTVCILPYINVPVDFAGSDFKFYVEFAGRSFLLVLLCSYHRFFLAWLGMIKE